MFTQHGMHKRPLVTRLGDDAIIRKVRIGGWRANDDKHIIIACVVRRRYSPRKRAWHPILHVTLGTHACIVTPLVALRLTVIRSS